MKYGETLRQRSVAAWRHYNIDYDDIKHFIKEQTTSGKGKSVAVPGRHDDKLQQFEDSLFLILKEQHHRIDLFVKSKAGEIRRRLEHSKRQLKSWSALATLATPASDQRISVGRLERYGKLENEVLKAGDDIKSLASFTSTQRTAFRKLLKKYKKWTGSTQLEDRFRTDVLDDPKSFVKLDLGPLLDDYSTTLQQIRSLYDARIRQRSGEEAQETAKSASAPSVVAQLQTALDSNSKLAFDDAIATVPLGDCGTFASYFVHPENIVELQVLLLQHSRFLTPRSRSNSQMSPISNTPQSDNFGQSDTDHADYFALEADDPERFAQEQNALTITEREHRKGSTPQKAKLCIRWNNDEEARIAFQPRSSAYQHAMMRKKFVSAIFTKDSTFSTKKAALSTESEQSLAAAKRTLDQDRNVKPLYLYSASRSRFVGINNTDQRFTLATLDTQATIQKVEGSSMNGSKSAFPFAVLLVRQDGAVNGGLLAALDHSHLVERVRGFSMEYHAIWQTANSSKIPSPFWLPVLDRDIRKLPPPAMKRTPSSAGRSPTSAGSVNGATDSTTAVETGRSDSAPHELEAPPIRSFRKKRRRNHLQSPSKQQQAKYWSEYDHPEDEEGGDAYVIYMDPNQKSTLDTIFDKLTGLFTRPRRPNPNDEEEEALLHEPSTPKSSESSDDDDDDAADTSSTRTPKPRVRSYGTLIPQPTTRLTSIPESHHHHHHPSPTTATTPRRRTPFLSHLTLIAYISSLTILSVAYVLAATGRHRQRHQVEFGVVGAVCSSLFFAIAGFASLLRQREVSWVGWGVGWAVLGVDVLGAGGLVSWLLD
ncbi:hypothetical protein LTR02_004783 [Friedmanniomyces endolithicus]|nr:hypothetical protein LTR94_019542 [Friedmanniomyces endolithicus]KAK0774471.1 hypothetical protein LTR38_016202 [Friedmanniomyces endolithicus]KAK0785223.1 hypothetical protein LTR75_013595 [Friedmanniomyces endolithicus]KAK0806502.1 hypothetical protein LTR59_003579 [Friedmanniomyces endolithicus]KAK0844562.1 hypothetical protein LTS02_015640 [Friedmanniomyces endolithicus]